MFVYRVTQWRMMTRNQVQSFLQVSHEHMDVIWTFLCQRFPCNVHPLTHEVCVYFPMPSIYTIEEVYLH